MYTYFIVENEDCVEWRIKIGFSKDPGKRIRELQTGNSKKLAIMGWIESGDRSLERVLHRKYQQHRLNGERFSIEPADILEELKRKSTSSFICIQYNAGVFLGCDKDAVPEYLGPWEWLDTELEDFCPQCGWGGGVHFSEAIGSENCLRCGYPTF